MEWLRFRITIWIGIFLKICWTDQVRTRCTSLSWYDGDVVARVRDYRHLKFPVIPPLTNTLSFSRLMRSVLSFIFLYKLRQKTNKLILKILQKDIIKQNYKTNLVLTRSPWTHRHRPWIRPISLHFESVNGVHYVVELAVLETPNHARIPSIGCPRMCWWWQLVSEMVLCPLFSSKHIVEF